MFAKSIMDLTPGLVQRFQIAKRLMVRDLWLESDSNLDWEIAGYESKGKSEWM